MISVSLVTEDIEYTLYEVNFVKNEAEIGNFMKGCVEWADEHITLHS